MNGWERGGGFIVRTLAGEGSCGTEVVRAWGAGMASGVCRDVG